MNPFPFLLIFRIQEGMLSAQCLEHIVPLSLQYESNYKKGGVGGEVCTFNFPCKPYFIRSNSPSLKVISQQPSKTEMFSLLAGWESKVAL